MSATKKEKPDPTAEKKQRKLDSDLRAGLYHGKLEDMRKLLEAGARVNTPVDEYVPENETDDEKKRRLEKGAVAPIHISAQAGRPDLVELFIEFGADVNEPKFKGSGPLHYAAASGKPESGLILLEHGADPNAVGEDGATPLMDCVISGNEKLFDALLPLTKNLDQQGNIGPWYGGEPNFAGDTALLRAANRGWTRQVKALHEHGASLTIAGRSQRNVLHVSAAMKNPDIVRYVLKHAPELANQPAHRGGLPLHKAITMRADECFDLLLPVTTDLEARETAEHPKDGDKRGNTPLLAAAAWGCADWVKALHEKGADITASGIADKNALHHAASHGDAALCSYILSHAPELLNAQDDDGNTPLHLAIKNKSKPTLDILLKHKPDVTIKNKEGYAPFLFAAFSDNAHAVKKLAKLTPDISETNHKGRNAVHISAARGNGNALMAYAKIGVSLSAPDGDGNSALILAAAAENPGALMALAELGVDLRQTGENNYSAMHAAVAAGRNDNVALLAQHGVSLYEPVCNGKRPIDMAQEGQPQNHFKTIFNFVRSEQTKQISKQIRRARRKPPKAPGPK